MKRLLLIGLLLVLLVVPIVSADYTENFQDYAAQGWVYSSGSAPTITQGTNAEQIVLTIGNPAGVNTNTYYNVPIASNYYSFTAISSSGGTNRLYLLKSDLSTLGFFTWTPASGQWEIIRDPSTGITNLLANGTAQAAPQTFATAPYYLMFYLFDGAHQTTVIDDFHIGDTNPKYWTSTIPPNWTVVKDFTNPANSGLYAGSSLIRTTYMYSNWSRGSGTSTSTVSLKNVASGLSYETLGMMPGYANVTRNNLSVLTATTSTAPTGLYSISQDSGTGSDNIAYFYFTAYGASMSWDKTQYYSGETAVSSWSITPSYFDLSTYSYTGKITDIYGNVKTSWSITSATGSQSTQLTSITYPQGAYYETLTATQKASPFTAYVMADAYTQVVMDTKLSGITYNATTGQIQKSTFINFTQLGVIINTTSDGTTATYNKTGFVPNSAIVIEPTFRPLYFVPVSFTPLDYGNYTINLYGTTDPINQTSLATNATIYGLVQSSPYFNATQGAIVNIWNATWLSNITTNATGYYNFTKLAWFSNYNMNATATGYTNTTPYVVNSSSTYASRLVNATRMDFLLSTLYPVTFTFKDSATGAIIPAVTVVDSNGYSQTTTAGVFTYSYPYSLVSFTFSSTGYSSSSTSYTITGATTATIYLTSQQTQTLSNWYSPHPVRIAAVDKYGDRLTGIDINCSAIANTFPPGANANWVQTMYGINPTAANDLLNGTLIMHGVTAGDGSTTFTMLASIGYSVSLNGSSITPRPYTTTIYPIDSEYTVWLTATAVNNTLTYTNNASLTYAASGTASYILGMSYQDTAASTSVVYFNVTYPNGTLIYSNQTSSFGAGLVTCSTIITNIRGNGQIWSYQALHTDGTWSNASRTVTGKGPEGVLIPLGFTTAGVPLATATVYYNWISMGILYLVAAVAGSRDTRFFAILIPVFAALLMYMGWFSAAVGFDLPGMIIFLGVLAVAYYMKDSLREKSGTGGPGSMIMNITFYLIILSAVVGLVNTSNLWGMGGMQMASAVNNTYTNVDLTTQVSSITSTGGILESVVSDVMILTQMAFSGLRAFLSIMLSIAFFSLTLTQIFPFITSSPMAVGLLVVLQVAIWLLYAKFIMDLFYKPSPGTSDF